MLNRFLRTAWFDELPEGERRAIGKKWRDNMKRCSCFMCGNPRRHFGPPRVSDRRKALAARYERRTAEEQYIDLVEDTDGYL
jgi:hypothetical protein